MTRQGLPGVGPLFGRDHPADDAVREDLLQQGRRGDARADRRARAA